MKKMKKNIISRIFGIVVVGLIAVACIFSFQKSNEEDTPKLGGLGSGTTNLVGTRVGTTTTGYDYPELPATNGTTSAITWISSEVDAVNFTIQITDASSTPNGIFYYQVLGSNDAYCNTATTSAYQSSMPEMEDISWYVPATAVEGTVTSAGANATGTVVSLTNITWKCLMFQANGSSTQVLVQMISKDSD